MNNASSRDLLLWAACSAMAAPVSGQASSRPVSEQFLGVAGYAPSLLRTWSSSDGCHVAFLEARGSKWGVVVDGRPGPEYDGIGKEGLEFSPDGGRLVYAALQPESQSRL